MNVKKLLLGLVLFLGTEYELGGFPVLSVPHFFLFFPVYPTIRKHQASLRTQIYIISPLCIRKNLSNPPNHAIAFAFVTLLQFHLFLALCLN